tara:strand:+ start:98 stop:316 length:219 start_codon:yes stop_codon:yes gene_type:complete
MGKRNNYTKKELTRQEIKDRNINSFLKRRDRVPGSRAYAEYKNEEYKRLHYASFQKRRALIKKLQQELLQKS